MRKAIFMLSLVVGFAMFFACSGGRLTEEEYLTRAQKFEAQGDIEDAIFSYKNLLSYYPDSKDHDSYRSKLLDLTVQAADKYAGTPKGESYVSEAMSMAEEQSDTLMYWIKFRMASKIAESDSEKAKALFEAIPVDGYYYAAQMALGKSDYKMANAAYEKLIEIYPDDPNNYKAIFLIGFNTSEYLKDYDKAKGYFERVLADYPNCDLAPSAKWMLDNMGKPATDIQFIDSTGKKSA